MQRNPQRRCCRRSSSRQRKELSWGSSWQRVTDEKGRGGAKGSPDFAVAGWTCAKKNRGAVGLEEDVRTGEQEEKKRLLI